MFTPVLRRCPSWTPFCRPSRCTLLHNSAFATPLCRSQLVFTFFLASAHTYKTLTVESPALSRFPSLEGFYFHTSALPFGASCHHLKMISAFLPVCHGSGQR